MPNYYDREFDPWVNGIRNIGTMIMQQPMLRAQAQERQQRAALMQAQMATQGTMQDFNRARTTKTDTETDLIKSDLDGEGQLAKGLRALAANPNDTNALADVFEGTGKGFRHNPQQTAQGIGTLLGQLKSLGGGTAAQAAQLQNPGNVYAADQRLAGQQYAADQRAATEYAKPVVLPRNATAIDREGNPIAAAPMSLRMGERLFLPTDGGLSYSQTPAAEGTPVPPKSAAGDVERLRLIRDVIKGTATPDADPQELIQKYDAATGATPAKQAGALPMPKTKAEMVRGATYQTSRGPAIWDGEKFVK